mgnify:CR=1 FL=1
MIKFLLDENISHETADFLKSMGYDAKSVAHFGLGGTLDEEIAKKAAATKRMLITLDLDFGEIFYFGTHQKLGVIVLRLKHQTVEKVNEALYQLLKSGILERNGMEGSLIIIGANRIRIRKKSR